MSTDAAAVQDRSPSALRSSLQVTVDLLAFAGTVTGVIVLPLWGKIASALLMHVILARLFVLGHDACHGSLYRSRVANEIVGRLLFLPTLTTYSLWHVGHNVAHHGFANLKGRDQVWVPLSPQEYAALPRWRRAIERLYRSIWGFGLYYFIELWWRKLFFPSRRHVGAQRKIFWVDSLTTLVMALAYIVLLIFAAVVTDQRWWVLLLCGAIMPFALWNHLMGMVIFVHHTGPEMRWFNKRSEWLRMRGVAELTRDVRLPWRIDKLLHGIMLHRAHHFDPRIPNYRLAQATRRLFADGLSSARSTVAGWRFLRELTRRCALYDYEARRWLGFPDKASPAGA